MKAEVIQASQAARRFSEIINRVRYQGQVFVVKRGREIVARIVPAGRPTSVAVADLSEIFAQLPALSEGERKSFRRDLRRVRFRAPLPLRKWD